MRTHTKLYSDCLSDGRLIELTQHGQRGLYKSFTVVLGALDDFNSPSIQTFSDKTKAEKALSDILKSDVMEGN